MFNKLGQSRISQLEKSTNQNKVDNCDHPLIYKAPWIVYSVGMSQNNTHNYLTAIGSYQENKTNLIHIIKTDPDQGKFEFVSRISHYFPPSKIRWLKPEGQREIIVSAGKYISIWNYDDLEQRAKHSTDLVQKQFTQYSGPQTQFDVHNQMSSRLVSTSLDSTFSIWDLNRQKLVNQVKGHDKEINDISFGQNPNVFATVGSDGTCRQFDIREIQKSVLLYQHSESDPLFKVTCDQMDGIYISITDMNREIIYLYDIRQPYEPLRKMKGHIDLVTQIGWSPTQRKTMCSTSDDGRAFIWDVEKRDSTEKIKCYNAELEINDFEWSQQPGIIGISYNSYFEILKID